MDKLAFTSFESSVYGVHLRLCMSHTAPFHGGNTGSNPVGDAIRINTLTHGLCQFAGLYGKNTANMIPDRSRQTADPADLASDLQGRISAQFYAAGIGNEIAGRGKHDSQNLHSRSGRNASRIPLAQSQGNVGGEYLLRAADPQLTLRKAALSPPPRRARSAARAAVARKPPAVEVHCSGPVGLYRPDRGKGFGAVRRRSS
jgi:hypothetical protein